MSTFRLRIAASAALVVSASASFAQTPPSAQERAAYSGYFGLVVAGAHNEIRQFIINGVAVDARDTAGRTPYLVAAFQNDMTAMELLAKAGADVRAKDNQHYDAITILAVANKPEAMQKAITLGGDPKAITSPYQGTALIAAAHLGHAEVVKVLIAAGASLDHVNNLGWTALIESIVLGDGGANHLSVLQQLLDAGAKTDLADRNGKTPLALATAKGFTAMINALKAKGAR
ncbi:MAG: ankyrin repeat domain-containing protein [Beijerinckiaceae bacterium]